MAKRPTRAWPSANDNGKRVIARTHSGKRVEGRMRSTWSPPGEDEEVEMFVLVLGDGACMDWSALKRWRFADADGDERTLAKWSFPFVGAWFPLDLVPLFGV